MSFSADEQAKLKAQWAKVAADHRTNGTAVFASLFAAKPDYKKMFTGFGEKTWSAMSDSIRLQCHGNYIMKTFGGAVDRLANPEAYKKFLLRLGGEHVQRKTGEEHFTAFMTCLVAQVKAANGGSIDEALWQKFTGDVKAHMVEGLKKPVDAPPSPSEESLKDIFNIYDSNSDGKLDEDEIYKMMGDLQQQATKEQVKAMIVEADVNGDGNIQIDEFVKVIRGRVK